MNTAAYNPWHHDQALQDAERRYMQNQVDAADYDRRQRAAAVVEDLTVDPVTWDDLERALRSL